MDWLSVAFNVGSGRAGFAGAGLVLAGAIFAVARGRMVYASRIDNTHVWLRGVDPAFLDALPEWTGRK